MTESDAKDRMMGFKEDKAYMTILNAFKGENKTTARDNLIDKVKNDAIRYKR